MKKFAIAGIAALAIAGSTARSMPTHRRGTSMQHMRMSSRATGPPLPTRIAAVHAGLEAQCGSGLAAGRDRGAGFRQNPIDRANARMTAQQNEDQQKPDDPVARLRERADNMATSAAAMKKIGGRGRSALQDPRRRPEAPARDPDPHGRPVGGGWRHRGFERGMMGGDRDRDGGRDHMDHMDHGDRDPSRL